MVGVSYSKVGENKCSDNMYSFGRRVLLTRSFLYFAFAFIFYLDTSSFLAFADVMFTLPFCGLCMYE